MSIAQTVHRLYAPSTVTKGVYEWCVLFPHGTLVRLELPGAGRDAARAVATCLLKEARHLRPQPTVRETAPDLWEVGWGGATATLVSASKPQYALLRARAYFALDRESTAPYLVW